MRDPLYERIYQFLTDRQMRAVETLDKFAVGSIVGSVRKYNEDVGIIASVKHAHMPNEDYTLALVCDGMGGMANGRQAALIAASTFVSRMLQMDRLKNPDERLNWALAAAQNEVFDEFRGDGGTTLSAIFLDQFGQGWLAHVGDSRVYATAADGTLRQLSRDDTVGAALKREHERRPDSNRLIQFIGMEGDLEPQVIPVVSDDCTGYLLTSDGAHGVTPDILSTIAQHAKNSAELVRKILSVADALGGLDNATAVHISSTTNNLNMASHISGEDRDYVLATILCSSGMHDIWITHADPRDSVHLQQDARQIGEEQNEYRQNDSVPFAKFQGTRKRGSVQRKAKARISDKIPLDVEKPVAKLDFFDDGKSKS